MRLRDVAGLHESLLLGVICLSFMFVKILDNSNRDQDDKHEDDAEDGDEEDHVGDGEVLGDAGGVCHGVNSFHWNNIIIIGQHLVISSINISQTHSIHLQHSDLDIDHVDSVLQLLQTLLLEILNYIEPDLT